MTVERHGGVEERRGGFAEEREHIFGVTIGHVDVDGDVVAFDLDRAGDEVVQIYARFPNSAIARPRRLLCGFQRATLQAGERRELSVRVRGVDLAHWDEKKHAFVLEPGLIELVVARSASDTQRTLGLTLA